MNRPVVLMLADGMRPDGLLQCGHPAVPKLLQESAVSLTAQAVMPSVTLPCHMSLFHSVTPQRHGILTNVYVPQVRPVPGLCEALRAGGRACAFFYSWEELRDLARVGSLTGSTFISGQQKGYRAAAEGLTTEALRAIDDGCDFLFLYFGLPDYAGHNSGWMGEEYLAAVHHSVGCMQQIIDRLPPEGVAIITADHGGHDRLHGEDVPEDMTIPLLLRGGPFAPGERFTGGSLLDVAPTIAALLEVPPPAEWEGKNLLQK